MADRGIPQPKPRSADASSLELAVDIYLISSSDEYADLCLLTCGGRELGVRRLVSARTLERSTEEAARLIETRLLTGRFVPRDGGGFFVYNALRGLLCRLGIPGRKAYLRLAREQRDDWVYFHVDGPALEASDERWVEFAQRRRGGGMGAELRWLLAGDPEALAELAESVGYVATPAPLDEWIPGDEIIQSVLLIGRKGGVADGLLREWCSASGYRALRWGALLALAGRGDTEALKRLRTVIAERFPLQDDDLLAEYAADVGDPDEFQFMLEYAALDAPERWTLIMGLIADRSPEMLAPRTATLIAIDENWDAADCPQAELRERIAEAYSREENAWLRGQMVELLASHPKLPE